MSVDDVKGSKRFELREGDTRTPYDIEITICSVDGANDGWLSYGATNLSLNDAWTENSSGTTVSGILYDTPTITSNRLELDLNYPPAGAGDYVLWAKIDYEVSSVTRTKTLRAARIKAY